MEATAVHPPIDLRSRIVGIDVRVPLLDGSEVPYVTLDNAASTPAFTDVIETVERFLPYYSNVHRGAGFKSRVSTAAYDEAHGIIGRFLGADLRTNTVILGKNTTEAVNKLSYRLPFPPDAVVLTTQLEHHSNDLPWRNRARVEFVRTTRDGRLDLEDFDRKLTANAGRIAVVTVSGASNVTGYIQPVHLLARMAHEAGAKIVVDAAQLAPHRRIDVKPDGDPEHLDFIVLSAHKMYAPFGTGVLVGPKSVFLEGAPEYAGGGTVSVVTPESVSWADEPDRDEAGTPNIVGAIALAVAAQLLMEAGMDAIAAHEEMLVRHALTRMKDVPGLRIYGESDPDLAREKVGVIPFNIEGVPHALAAAILGYEGGIGVRNGCFCAQPYVVHLLGLSEAEADVWRARAIVGDRSDMPGLVRASFGCFNTLEEADRLVDMLHRIARREYRGSYKVNRATGEFLPEGYRDPIRAHFHLNGMEG